MDEFNFELFKGKKGKYNITVSISKPGILSFSSGMAHKYSLSTYKGAELYFDTVKNTIAIRLMKDEAPDMFNLKNRDENKGSFIACKSFITAHELEKYFGKRFTPTEIDYPGLGNLMLVNLNDPKN
jgi:hypothetical protein